MINRTIRNIFYILFYTILCCASNILPFLLSQLQDEIVTLRQVLAAKVKASHELKKKLGITPMTEMKDDLKKGVEDLKSTDA